MDLATIKPIEKELNIVHPATGEETGLILTIVCAQDSRYQENVRDVNDWALTIGKDVTKDHEREFRLRMESCHIVGFRFEGDAVWNGETPKYSRDVALEMIKQPVVRDQVWLEANKIKDFYKA